MTEERLALRIAAGVGGLRKQFTASGESEACHGQQADEEEMEAFLQGTSRRATHRAADPGWIVRHVLQYGPEAELLEPPEYRLMVRETAERLVH